MTDLLKIHTKILDKLLSIKINLYPNLKWQTIAGTRNQNFSKGQWFHEKNGDIYLSFGNGQNWKYDIPLVGLKLSKNGAFLFVSSDEYHALKKYENYFIKKSAQLKNNFDIDNFKKVNDSYYETIIFNGNCFQNNNFLNVIDNFFSSNSVIPIYLTIWFSCLNFFSPKTIKEIDYTEIDLEIFNQQMDIIFETRKKTKFSIGSIKSTPYFAITQLCIYNFYGIKNLKFGKIPKTTKWIFLTGMNGSGKTTILKAIACALTNSHNRIMNISHQRYKVEAIIKENYAAKKELFLNFNSTNNDQDFKLFANTGFAAYGPNRHSRIINTSTTKVSQYTKKQTSTYNIFNDDAGLIDFLDGLRKIKAIRENVFYQRHFLNQLTALYRDLMPGFVNIKWPSFEDVENNRVLFYFEDEKGKCLEPVANEQLSSGNKSIINLIGDLMFRLLYTNTEKLNFYDYKGIVLIDEIDSHLHPELQKSIIQELDKSFPKVQFIVTTHSPIPLLGAPKNSVFFHVKNEKSKGIKVHRLHQVEQEFMNWLPNTILTSPIFNFANLIPRSHDSAKRMRTEDNYFETVKRDEIKSQLRQISSKMKPLK